MTPMTPQGAPQKSNTNTVLVVVLVVGGLSLLCCVGGLAAIAVPNFLKFNVRAKQGEVKMNLKAAYTAQKAWFAEKDTYSESVEEVGFLPEPHNRYRYFLAVSGDPLVPGAPDGGFHPGIAADLRVGPSPDNAALLAGIPPPLLAEAGLHGKCPDACHITILAAGNIDGDSTIDVWSVSTKDRSIDGVTVPAGKPHMHTDDTNN